MRISSITNPISFLLIFTAFTGYSQHFNMEPPVGNNLIGLKASLPSYEDDEFQEFSTLTGVYTFYTLVNLKEDLSLYGELPLVIAKGDFLFGESESETGLANIFIALRKTLNENKTSQLSFGAFLPTVGKDKFLRQVVGFTTNWYRPPQFASAITLYLNFAHYSPAEKKAILGIEVGPDLMISTEGEGSDVLLRAAAKAGNKFNKLWLWAEYNSTTLVTGSDIDFSDRIIHFLVLGGQLRLGKFNPAIFYSLPFNQSISDQMNGVLGVKTELEI